ncbi:2-oxo acid dehydrogenase subunit E2 [Synechococcus sp. CS-602]|uniref:dihydrolipoamide acetyltransferase family protein n=1 Tax=Synechococcaceae TaxID=1890426 RepID=UPI0008FF44A2|nr:MULTISPECIES: dihydrolipoamide acetyltransferase family protein [Synechococcaceae]MCT4363426.1 2-oxo acid dehydrogenase subunit E2 [Candidatus Regnicoccus frigidus MAG-AL1]APD48491.1 branched-chain alpha-keto acid dehydrogenase subunit E2 [Synechococcus sp. SynAce01]MCT0205282.1 2-oxo acid dehydrogenase subunit E2 [Synechococcus sp. CS-602]MCT0246776.1 2-oxo acid dehydrogenase subunit E2 [Synechococcus sp. CS-601]MCT4367921.1 2-oxo acid dehydrogenase subunit E2 [Candidatus Regnicoccus frigi
MATHDIFMPALSSTMTEGKIVEWLKKPGDPVARGESVLVVESDKADMDVEAFQEGFLAAVLMPAGESAPVGETIGLIVETEAEIAAAQASAPSSSAAAVAAPSKPPAAATAPVKPAAEPAPAAKALVAPVAASPATAPVAEMSNATTTAANGRLVATPRAKKLAKQLGVALESLRGSGPHGRIQAEDVERASGQPLSVPRVSEGSSSYAPATAALAGNGASAAGAAGAAPLGQAFGSPGETVAFNTLQQAVIRNMAASLTVPCFHVGYTITTDRFDAFYKQVKAKGVTMTALLAKAVAVVLARHPQVNAAYSEAGMAYPASVNVAVAVAMDDGGLLTPVLANADKTDLYSLSRSWADLVARSRTKQLKPAEYSTGTFTLSNLGMYGVDRFDAILPPGTGAILAVAASRPCVVAASDGSISVKRQMQVNLTADHRVIYGTHGAAFLKDLAALIETDPESLAL